MRLSGTLRSWNDDRGFGFIAPTHGGAELFVHISALPRDGTRPTVGEKLTYELGRGRDGKPQAVNVIRQAIGLAAVQSASPATLRVRGPSVLPKLVGVLLVLALGGFGYSQFQQRAAPPLATAAPVPAVPERPLRQMAEPASFRCDGRTHCSQMTSCQEATWFLQHCPGVKMDGNHDGVPCEEQWCSRQF